MTTEPENLTGQEYEEVYYTEDGVATGWGLFAGMMLYGVSVFAFMAMCIGWGVPNTLQFSAFGMKVDWLWYGIFDGLTAIIAFFAAGAVWKNMKFGYYLGLIIATLSAGRWLLFIPAEPFWGVAMLVIWALVIYGLIRDREYFK